MLQLTLEQFEKVIHRKLKTNQLLLFISIIISLAIFVLDRSYVWWSLYFLLIGALSLPNINRCKEDRKLFKESKFKEVKGKVLDLFPEKDGGQNWIIFLEEENTSKLQEFVVSVKPNIEVEQFVVITYTPKMNIPVRIELVNA